MYFYFLDSSKVIYFWQHCRLVLGWVTVCWFKFCCTILVFSQIPRPNQPGIPSWVGKKSNEWYFYIILDILHKSVFNGSHIRINRLITHKKLPLMYCYHIFSNSRVVYLAKNHYENFSPQMVLTNPTGSWPKRGAQKCKMAIFRVKLHFAWRKSATKFSVWKMSATEL